MRSSYEALKKARSIRKLIESLVGFKIDWKAEYEKYTSWIAIVPLSDNQPELIETSIRLLNVEVHLLKHTVFKSNQYRISLDLFEGDWFYVWLQEEKVSDE